VVAAKHSAKTGHYRLKIIVKMKGLYPEPLFYLLNIYSMDRLLQFRTFENATDPMAGSAAFEYYCDAQNLGSCAITLIWWRAISEAYRVAQGLSLPHD
jgi:hypothetical protein